jgi:hypothetical protein
MAEKGNDEIGLGLYSFGQCQQGRVHGSLLVYFRFAEN